MPKGGLVDLAVFVLEKITRSVSPRVREFVVEKLYELRELATDTANDFDDMLVQLLFEAFDVEEDERSQAAGEVSN